MGDLKLLHRIVKFIIYVNLCKFIRNHKKCFFSFISQPILIVIALFGRAELCTLNFYTEFWNYTPVINYGNLCKFIPKITKIASSPTFLDRFSFCLFDLIGLGRGFKTSTQNFEINQYAINYGNLCKFIQKITKIASSPTFLDWFSFCLFDLIGIGGSFKTSTQNFEINQLCKFMQIYSKSQIKSQKMLLLIHFSTNFDLVRFIW